MAAEQNSINAIAGALLATVLVGMPLALFFGWLIRRAWRGEPIGVRAAPLYLLVQLIKSVYEAAADWRRRRRH